LVKIALGRGFIGPDQAGIEIEESENETPFDKQMKQKQQSPFEGKEGSQKGKSGEGRPKNSKDSPGLNRDRDFNARGSYEIASDIGNFLNGISEAKQIQSAISECIAPGILKHYGKKNMRSLTAKESLDVEFTKFRILSNLPKNAAINDNTIASILSKNPKIPVLYSKYYNALLKAHNNNVKRPPTIEEIRGLQAATYSICTNI
jgi:hypothetical protein